MTLSNENRIASCGSPSSSQLNSSIKTIYEQCRRIDSKILQLIGELFVLHGHADDFGVCRVHRHGWYREGYAMVHSYSFESVDQCQMLPVMDSLLYPCAFFLDAEHQFLPYEYSSTPQVQPKSQFIAEFAQFLVAHELHDTLGLCRAWPSEPPWTEHVDGDGGTVAIQSKDSNQAFGQDGIITQWGFLSEGSKVWVKPLRECKSPEGGGHKKPD
jgi:hypothetical protein